MHVLVGQLGHVFTFDSGTIKSLTRVHGEKVRRSGDAQHF